MRRLLIILWCWAGLASVWAQGEDPLTAMEAAGSITLSDGSSWYTFFKEGGFQSGPLGDDGRRLEGSWVKEKEGGLLRVQAAYVYYEGEAVRRDGWREILFRIAPGVRRPFREEKVPAITEFHAYLLVEEMRRIPEPGGEE